MNSIVILKHVPDLVEELEIDESGTHLNGEWLKLIPSEYDVHALEEALLLKEKSGGTVTVLALDGPEIDESLFTALAKGADRVLKITGSPASGTGTHTAAKIFATVLSSMKYDAIFTGVQAIDDIDGSIGGILAQLVGAGYVGVIRGVRQEDTNMSLIVGKEYPGGTLAEFRVPFPAVLGIQAASKPPRYVPIGKIRQTMKSASIESIALTEGAFSHLAEVGATVADGGMQFLNLPVQKMYKPECSGGAEMITGSLNDIARRLASILAEKGVVK